MSNLAQKRPFAYFVEDDSINHNNSNNNNNNEYNNNYTSNNVDLMSMDYNAYNDYNSFHNTSMDFDLDTLSNNNMVIYNSFTPQDRTFLIDLVESLKKNKWAPSFLQPVDPIRFGIPDYFDIIKEPMDLSTVSEKLHQYPSPYISREQAIRDIQLIFDNCYLYNNKTDPVCFEAKKLEEAFKKGLLKMPEKSQKVLDHQHVEMMPDDQWRRCEAIVKELKKPKYAKFTWPFLVPVDPSMSGAPDYFNIIKEPMDMSTYEKKLYDFEYTSEDELADDIRLMLDNCFRYNPPGHEIRNRGEEFLKVFEDQWAKLHNTNNNTSSGKKPLTAPPPKPKKKKSSSKKQTSYEIPQYQPEQQQQQQPQLQLQHDINHDDNLLFLDPSSMMLDTAGFANVPQDALSGIPSFHSPPPPLTTTIPQPILPQSPPPQVAAIPPLVLPNTNATAATITPSSSIPTTLQQNITPLVNTDMSLGSLPSEDTKPVINIKPEEKKQGSNILRLKISCKRKEPEEEKEVTPSPTTSSKKQHKSTTTPVTKIPGLALSKEPPEAHSNHASTATKKAPVIMQNADKWMEMAKKAQQQRKRPPPPPPKPVQQPTFSFDNLIDTIDQQKKEREQEIQREREKEREFREQMDTKRSHDRAERMKELGQHTIDISKQKLAMKQFETKVMSYDHDFRDLIRRQRDTTNYRPLYEPEFIRHSSISLRQLKEKILNWNISS